MQDMPEFFKDHFDQWMRHTLTLLTDGDNSLLTSARLILYFLCILFT